MHFQETLRYIEMIKDIIDIPHVSAGLHGGTVIVGAGAVGMECAINLAMAGKAVTVVEMAPDFPGLQAAVRGAVLPLLGDLPTAARTAEILSLCSKPENALCLQLFSGR
ncbi:MAG: NAD-binding protein [Firmicutes bacterium]|jgi:NADPH-dependent 2,4-dienoyl-CoA reductase/sulfur reductase-like enzyme|nr:NAD-binding protein [Bacillota bacterium]